MSAAANDHEKARRPLSGTFDPVTLGHPDIIKRAEAGRSSVIVAPLPRPTFA
jgi:phosphopantetheine adenylyltransferase